MTSKSEERRIEAMVVASRDEFERFCRASAEGEMRAHVLGQRWLWLDPEDLSLTPCLMRDGFWEAWLSVAIMRFVRPGMLCLDVGANVGYFSLLMAEAGARVLAFEPRAKTFSLLSRTARENTSLITPIRAALGTVNGNRRLLHFGDLHASSSFLPSEGWEITDKEIVQVCRADTVVKDYYHTLAPINFVKIDVEGMEAEVWEGMKEIRRRNPNLVACIELHAKAPDLLKFYRQLSLEKHVRRVNEQGELEQEWITEENIARLLRELEYVHLWAS